jgi:Raf kinase inhibitor-like YbhB/YbcL family protein
MAMSLTSAAFKEGENIPSQYTCDGINANPGIVWSEVPAGSESLVLIMEDPDIPESVKASMNIEVFDHWVVYNIPPVALGIPEATVPSGVEGMNSRGNPGYVGPCPPDGEHRYFLRLYALDTELVFEGTPTKQEVVNAMKGHVLATAELMGLYERKH